MSKKKSHNVIFKDAALRDQYGVGAIWTESVTEPCSGLNIIHYSDAGGQFGDLSVLQHPRQT